MNILISINIPFYLRTLLYLFEYSVHYFDRDIK